MKFEELLNEEYLDVLCEATVKGDMKYRKAKSSAIKKGREKAHKRKPSNSDISPDTRVGFTPKAKANVQKHQHIDSDYNDSRGTDKYKPGRERLIAAVVRLVRQNGGSVSVDEVRNYVYEKYKQWTSSSPKAKAIFALEKRARGLGFNPRMYKNQKPGASAGKNKTEYDGRAFFFTALMNMFGNHFLKEQGIEMTRRFAHLKPAKKGSVEYKKIKERETERQRKVFHSK